LKIKKKTPKNNKKTKTDHCKTVVFKSWDADSSSLLTHKTRAM